MEQNKVCKYCSQEFISTEGKAFASHTRWCDKNKENGDKGRKNLSIAKKALDIKRLGEFKEYPVNCHKCSKNFTVKEREKKFPSKEKYFCSVSCRNSRVFTAETNAKRAKSNSIASKKLWDNEEYVKKQMSTNQKFFTSKNEVFIRDYFINNYFEDEWTFGGNLKFNNTRICRDLYSKKLKVCFEYDGIWHFKDIHGQLKEKQEKDQALQDWCELNNYRLIRMSESFFNDNKISALKMLEEIFYKKSDNIIKLGSEY